MTVTNGDIFRVDVVGDYNATDDLVNVYQLQKIAGANISEALAVQDIRDFMDALYTIIKGLQGALAVWRRVRVQNVQTGILLGELAFAAAITGTEAGDSGVAQAAMVASFGTVVPKVTPRKYWGPVAESLTTQWGMMGATALSRGADAAAYLLANQVLTNGTWQYGYFSPKSSSWQEPVAALVSAAPGMRRSRRIGTGS